VPDVVQRPLFEVPPPAAPERPEAVTERTMLDALHERYGAVLGNGRRYVVAEHVRSHASFDARRTADFIALDTWKSGRFDFIGHEVKVSRADWLRELREPGKAAEFTPFMNRWWIVAAHGAVVRPEELPDGWGLMTLRLRTLGAVRNARRTDAQPMPPTRLVALMRAVQATAASQARRAATRDRNPERNNP
jgi:hypothetical protein